MYKSSGLTSTKICHKSISCSWKDYAFVFENAASSLLLLLLLLFGDGDLPPPVVFLSVHQHYDQSHQTSVSYNSYGGLPHSSGGTDTDRPPSGTPSASVHSSPSRHQGNYTYILTLTHTKVNWRCYGSSVLLEYCLNFVSFLSALVM